MRRKPSPFARDVIGVVVGFVPTAAGLALIQTILSNLLG